MIRAKEHGPFPNAPNPFHLQAFFEHRYIAGSFVCAKIRNNNVYNVGKSKSLSGCGSAGYGRITGQRAPRFSDKSHVLSDRSLNGTRFRRIIRNARVRPAS
jgi:hypothetical protein